MLNSWFQPIFSLRYANVKNFIIQTWLLHVGHLRPLIQCPCRQYVIIHRPTNYNVIETNLTLASTCTTVEIDVIVSCPTAS